MSEAVSHDIHEFRLKELEVKALTLHGKQTGEYLSKVLETMKHYKQKAQAADKEITTKDAELARLREALERSVLALDDWLNVYAEELCDKDRVAQAKSRIKSYGTVGYIASVQQQNREALKPNDSEDSE